MKRNDARLARSGRKAVTVEGGSTLSASPAAEVGQIAGAHRRASGVSGRRAAPRRR